MVITGERALLLSCVFCTACAFLACPKDKHSECLLPSHGRPDVSDVRIIMHRLFSPGSMVRLLLLSHGSKSPASLQQVCMQAHFVPPPRKAACMFASFSVNMTSLPMVSEVNHLHFILA